MEKVSPDRPDRQRGRRGIYSDVLSRGAWAHGVANRKCAASNNAITAFRGKEHAWITKVSVHCRTILRCATGAHYQLI